MNKLLVIALCAAALVGAGLLLWPRPAPQNLAANPDANDAALMANFDGRALFDKNCATCHGAQGKGSSNGPPLVHRIYEPNHHGDGAFYRAAAQGVRAHHWQFGNMPPIAGVTTRDVEQIIAYIRALQRANGIH